MVDSSYESKMGQRKTRVQPWHHSPIHNFFPLWFKDQKLRPVLLSLAFSNWDYACNSDHDGWSPATERNKIPQPKRACPLSPISLLIYKDLKIRQFLWACKILEFAGELETVSLLSVPSPGKCRKHPFLKAEIASIHGLIAVGTLIPPPFLNCPN